MLSVSRKLFSSILKLLVRISATVGVIISARATIDAFMGGETVFMYFTIQSNIAIALVMLVGLILLALNKPIKYYWYVIKLVFTVSITLTGAVFTFVLAPTMGGAAWGLANVLTHVVVPVASIIDFFVACVGCKYRRVDVIYVTIPPLLYAVYAGVGYALNWKFSPSTNYPYFFLNWGSKAGAFGFSNELPFMGVVWWILLLLVLLIGVSLLYLLILDKLGSRKKGE